ncbi:hypothetical protein SLEP1_g8644 [Rubroshorea leprosula]|uniref:Uncharacterized protein n=1 Tax=Rubroshorea leprosula TaxID=152421 RepID=A0AAV5IBG2_9ROSI|nr:hypothetical protein SLEP1_g8644 [Rubroshorea leprosula]
MERGERSGGRTCWYKKQWWYTTVDMQFQQQALRKRRKCRSSWVGFGKGNNYKEKNKNNY